MRVAVSRVLEGAQKRLNGCPPSDARHTRAKVAARFRSRPGGGGVGSGAGVESPGQALPLLQPAPRLPAQSRPVAPWPASAPVPAWACSSWPGPAAAALAPAAPPASPAGCPPCAPSACPPLPSRGCPLGRVRDACGCCWQCARGEGEACGGGGSGWGRCAAGLECRRRRSGSPVGACVCKSRYPVCGSDGLTYPSACQLRAASLRARSRGERAVEQRAKGPCEQGPSIVTPPKDIWNVTGAQIYLSCEVIGVPTPILTWNKVAKGQRTELLPGDRDNLAIQTRGGPEKHEVTGWVLISPLSKDDGGEYECHASNSQGEATASARITVVDSLQEIPTLKGGETEL